MDEWQIAGHHIEDPSEDAVFDLISELNGSDNTFIVIQPDEDDPTWLVSAAVLDEGGYQIVRRDSGRPHGRPRRGSEPPTGLTA
jgi:hypothetical protein